MALEMNDLLALKTMDSKSEMTPYEHYMVSHKESKKASGVAIAGLTVGVVGAVAGISAWVFGGVYANAKGNQAREAAATAKEVANAQYNATLQLIAQGNANTKDSIDRLLLGLQRETDARVAQGTTISQTITDTISGQQQGSQSQSTSVENSAYATAMNQIISDRLTGRSSLDAQPVCIYSAPQPCGCPGCGCGQ